MTKYQLECDSMTCKKIFNDESEIKPLEDWDSTWNPLTGSPVGYCPDCDSLVYLFKR